MTCSDTMLEKVYPEAMKKINCASKGSDKWIQKAIKRPGALHSALGVPQNKNIPAKKLKIKENDTTRMKRMKTLAKTLSGFNK